MLDWEFPWAFLALPLPYFVWRFFPAHTETVEALRVPFFTRLTELTQATPGKGAVVRRRSIVRTVLLVAIWIATVLALCKPTFRSHPIVIEKSARDLLLAVDLSGSMETSDLKDASGSSATRLDIVKEVLAEFIERREGDRLGLIVFGAAPYTQVPLTLDTSLVTRLLEDTRTRMAGDNTTLGDAIGLSIRTFERSSASNRVLVVLTDGNDTGSTVPPVTAARIAADKGITIHVIGVGDPTLAGEERLNEKVLLRIAQLTGGQYFHASDRDELLTIYQRLDRLEKIEFESHSYTPTTSVFYYPLGCAAILVTVFLLLTSLSSFGPLKRGTSR